MRPSWVCVNVSQNVTVSFVEYAMNSPCFGRAMQEKRLALGTGHSETVDPVDAPNCLIVLSDTTKRWLLDQRRPALHCVVTCNGMCTSKRPPTSQTRTESQVEVAIRSPRGEYFAALTISSWSSVRTFLRVATSQTVAVRLCDAVTSRVESGEKSTPKMVCTSSLCMKTFSNVFASHMITSPQVVPAAIHLPSFDTARQGTSRDANVAICLPSSIGAITRVLYEHINPCKDVK